MKKSPLLFLFSLLFMVGCNNDLDLTAPTKDIPIVYGVFSKLETDHYIRIEKAFIDDEIPAADLAIDSENFLYDDITVQIIKDGIAIDLERIDGSTEGFPRETGFFDNDPNVLYKLENVGFSGNQTITLNIDRGPGFDLVTSSTQIVNNIELKLPNPLQGDKLDIRPDPDRPTTLVFAPASNSKIFDIFITFHYKEISSAGQVSEKEVVWTFTRNQDVDGTGLQTAKNDGLNFYNLLLENIPVEPGVVRRFTKFSIDIVGGGQAIRDYVALTQANTGITSSQAVPNFSNLSEGLGIFSSKFTYHLDSLDISQVGRLELESGEILSDLNFDN
jgi:hypothetical protein